LAQIWFEMQAFDKPRSGSEPSVEQMVDEWFENKCAPTTYKR
jgi:hypothetical protein